MSDLYHQLDSCACQLKKAAENQNATVRKRIQKLCDEMMALRPWVQNIAVFKDCVPDGFDFRKIYDYKFKRQTCAGCRCDLTMLGGWVYPQEPKNIYCTYCHSKKFDKQMKEMEAAKVYKDRDI